MKKMLSCACLFLILLIATCCSVETDIKTGFDSLSPVSTPSIPVSVELIDEIPPSPTYKPDSEQYTTYMMKDYGFSFSATGLEDMCSQNLSVDPARREYWLFFAPDSSIVFDIPLNISVSVNENSFVNTELYPAGYEFDVDSVNGQSCIIDSNGHLLFCFFSRPLDKFYENLVPETPITDIFDISSGRLQLEPVSKPSPTPVPTPLPTPIISSFAPDYDTGYKKYTFKETDFSFTTKDFDGKFYLYDEIYSFFPCHEYVFFFPAGSTITFETEVKLTQIHPVTFGTIEFVFQPGTVIDVDSLVSTYYIVPIDDYVYISFISGTDPAEYPGMFAPKQIKIDEIPIEYIFEITEY